MNSWCESCARKSCCYTMEIRPRCYVATTNTASGTPESYLAKSLRYSRDSHEIAKDEPQTDRLVQTNVIELPDTYQKVVFEREITEEDDCIKIGEWKYKGFEEE